MMGRVLRITAASLAVVLAAPSLAGACNIPIRAIGPVKLKRGELRRPVLRASTSTQWGLDASWSSVRPRLSQFVRIKGAGAAHGASYATQRALSIDARGPEDTRWFYFDDEDADTPPCQMVGQIEWQPPKLYVRESATEVRIAAASQRTVGDRAGCTYGFELGLRDCPNLTRAVVRLRAPVGSRTIYFEHF